MDSLHWVFKKEIFQHLRWILQQQKSHLIFWTVRSGCFKCPIFSSTKPTYQQHRAKSQVWRILKIILRAVVKASYWWDGTSWGISILSSRKHPQWTHLIGPKLSPQLMHLDDLVVGSLSLCNKPGLPCLCRLISLSTLLSLSFCAARWASLTSADSFRQHCCLSFCAARWASLTSADSLLLAFSRLCRHAASQFSLSSAGSLWPVHSFLFQSIVRQTSPAPDKANIRSLL